jgi:hypothetical protein
MRQINPESEYLAMQPKFSKDFSRLAYVGRDEKFLSHSGTYQLKMLEWPSVSEEHKSKSETILDVFKDIPSVEDDFGGLYGY